MSLATDVIVVSGLPRSGTSLMMQMLHAGGLEAITDKIREADTDNPRGYFEFERVKKTKDDPSWVPEARGKVVKLVSSLLYDLPTNERYRVIFMRRDMEEILESQDKMLERLQRPTAPREKMRGAFDIHLQRLFAWVPQQSHLTFMEVSYNDLLADPAREINRIASFLDQGVSTSHMRDAIDEGLYRNRHSLGQS